MEIPRVKEVDTVYPEPNFLKILGSTGNFFIYRTPLFEPNFVKLTETVK